MRPDMQRVKAYAKKYGIKAEIRESTRPGKKLMVLVEDRPLTGKGRWIHFGSSMYEDFTTHQDKTRQAAYCLRAGGIRDKHGFITGNDPLSPNFYAMRLLWDCTPTKSM